MIMSLWLLGISIHGGLFHILIYTSNCFATVCVCVCVCLCVCVVLMLFLMPRMAITTSYDTLNIMLEFTHRYLLEPLSIISMQIHQHLGHHVITSITVSSDILTRD